MPNVKSKYVVTCSHGFEPYLQKELARLNIQKLKSGHGSVEFTGTLQDAFRTMLWTRLGSRVLMEIGRFEGTSQEELFDGIYDIPWEEHMDVRDTLWIDFTGYSRDIRHTQFASRKAKDAIADRFRDNCGSRPSVDKDADLRIHIHLHHGLFTVSIDLCGVPLHIRTPNKHITDAPLKETLAAAMLYASGWDKAYKKGTPLMDPMCGSGTIVLEAMGMACNRAPGLLRQDWNVFRWKQFEQKQWDTIVQEAKKVALDKPMAPIFGLDMETSAIECVRYNAKQQKVPLPTLTVQPLHTLNPSVESGWLVTNPPYGERIGSHAHIEGIYQTLGERFKHLEQWRCYLLCPPNDLYQKTGFHRTEERITLYNGPLKCRFIELDMNRPVHPEAAS
jgi:23S rRNA (guanine2445-N2)-methyltransferase / 23S rRNA (guanine2069-N7)-methyltransferase